MKPFPASLILLAAVFLLASTLPVRAAMEDYPRVRLQALDKTTARTETFEAKVGSTIQYGALYIKIQSCRKAPPIEQPESAAFLQIWEIPPETGKSEWVFSGWMFASSPALSAMDHPVYDVWVLDCLGKPPQTEETTGPENNKFIENNEKSASPSPAEDNSANDSSAE